jgi:hypothetical protein
MTLAQSRIGGILKFILPLLALAILACMNSTEPKETPVITARLSFDSDSELSAWNLGSAVGATDIDTAKYFEGKGAIHFLPKSGCYIIDRKVGIPVTENTNYKIELNMMMNAAAIPGAFCAGDFILIIKQGNEELLYESFFDAPDWELKTVYFKAKSNLPVNVNLILDKETWIDNMSFIHVN